MLQRKRSSSSTHKQKQFKSVIANQLEVSDEDDYEHTDIDEHEIDEELQQFLDTQNEDVNYVNANENLLCVQTELEKVEGEIEGLVSVQSGNNRIGNGESDM